jgi:hypothetical protein
MTLDQWDGQPADILSHIETSHFLRDLQNFRDLPDRRLRYRAGAPASHRQNASAAAVPR